MMDEQEVESIKETGYDELQSAIEEPLTIGIEVTRDKEAGEMEEEHEETESGDRLQSINDKLSALNVL